MQVPQCEHVGVMRVRACNEMTALGLSSDLQMCCIGIVRCWGHLGPKKGALVQIIISDTWDTTS